MCPSHCLPKPADVSKIGHVIRSWGDGEPAKEHTVRGEAVAQAEGEGRAGAGAKGNHAGFFSPGSTQAIFEFLARRSPISGGIQNEGLTSEF